MTYPLQRQRYPGLTKLAFDALQVDDQNLTWNGMYIPALAGAGVAGAGAHWGARKAGQLVPWVGKGPARGASWGLRALGNTRLGRLGALGLGAYAGYKGYQSLPKDWKGFEDLGNRFLNSTPRQWGQWGATLPSQARDWYNSQSWAPRPGWGQRAQQYIGEGVDAARNWVPSNMGQRVENYYNTYSNLEPQKNLMNQQVLHRPWQHMGTGSRIGTAAGASAGGAGGALMGMAAGRRVGGRVGAIAGGVLGGIGGFAGGANIGGRYGDPSRGHGYASRTTMNQQPNQFQNQGPYNRRNPNIQTMRA
jgi:hypothetical protein